MFWCKDCKIELIEKEDKYYCSLCDKLFVRQDVLEIKKINGKTLENLGKRIFILLE